MSNESVCMWKHVYKPFNNSIRLSLKALPRQTGIYILTLTENKTGYPPEVCSKTL